MKRFTICILCLFAIISISAQVLGPTPVYYNQPTPSGYSKVVVYSIPDYSGGGISLTKDGSIINLCASVVYTPIWYYFVPSGVYTVSQLSPNFRTMINAQQVSVGSIVDFKSSGYIAFIPL